MKIDLHLHSHVSDGDLSPGELMARAAAAGLGIVALTDHDTAAGVDAALTAAASLPIRVVPGIEMSTRWGDHELHVLGYWIDPHAPAIQEHQAASVHRRTDRMERMVANLQRMGIPITYEEVASAAGPEARSIGRPHLARALLAAGHTRYYGEAFARFISDAGPAFVPQDFPSPAEAIAMIHAAGGLAAWAHPPLPALEELMPRMAGWGLDGVECYRPSLTPVEVEILLGTARHFGLLPTGGSDWHGPHRAALGDFFVRPDQVRGVLEAGGLGS